MLAAPIERPPETGATWWIPLALVLLLAAFAVVGLIVLARREPEGELQARVLAVLRRLTGLPAWCAAGIAIALWSLLVAMIGFVWDVAWHADLGRDKALFTPPHVMILTGLIGMGVAAAATVKVATWEDAQVGSRPFGLRVPWSALPLGLMSAGAVVGFPLDDYWHRTYGIDVTMWSPTHLLMIGGASLAPLAVWLMLAEAGVRGTESRLVRLLSEVLAGATLVGLSTFQLEFDLGIPQWQVLYHPVLIAMTMGIGLVGAREALGKGGAVRATLGFLALRGLLAVLVGPVFGLSTPRFPLYLAGAVIVEAIFLAGGLSPLQRVAASGLLIGTVGMAAEWGWTQVWGWQPWQARLLAWWWVVVAMALIGSLIGSALGRAVAHGPRLVTYQAVAVALAGLAVLLAVPYPRHGADIGVTVSAEQVGARVPAVTREGLATFERQLSVRVAVSKPAIIKGADVFRVLAWQGGRLVIRPLRATSAGDYAIRGTIPSGGTWKSIVFLERGSIVAAAPVEFPADPTYGQPAIPAPLTAARSSRFERASHYLIRESHNGSALPAVLAYTGLGLVAITWFVALVGVGEVMTRRRRKPPGPFTAKAVAQ